MKNRYLVGLGFLVLFVFSVNLFAQQVELSATDYDSPDQNTLLPSVVLPNVEPKNRDSDLFSNIDPNLDSMGDSSSLEVPGKVIAPDIQIFLSQFIPRIDEYLQYLILQLVDVQVNHVEGRTILDVGLNAPEGAAENTGFSFRIGVQERDNAGVGEIYEVRLGRKLHIEVSMAKDQIIVQKIRGISLFCKIPMVSEKVDLRAVTVSSSDQEVTIYASALGGLLRIYGKGNIGSQKIYGVNWLKSILLSLWR